MKKQTVILALLSGLSLSIISISGCGGGSGTFAGPLLNTVQTTTQQNVLLLAGTKSAGSGVQINNQLVTPIDDTTDFSLAVTLTPGLNHLVLTLLDKSGHPSTADEHFIEYLDNTAGAPRLITPTTEARPSTYFPTFHWATAGVADSIELFTYRLELADDRLFSQPVETFDAGTDLSMTIPTPLGGGSYFWRVCAQPLSDVTAPFQCSSPRRFFIGRNPSDLNNDGLGDAVIGAPQNDFYDLDSGAVALAFGTPTGSAPNSGYYSDLVDQRIVGLTYQGNFGAALVQGIDVNGDGIGDLLVGAPGAAGSQQAGRVLAFFGAAAFPYDPALEFPAGDGYVGFGRSMALVGDLNGDGLEDVAIGAPDSPNGGVVDIFCGHATLGLAYCASLRRPTNPTEPQQLPDRFGAAVTRLGDFNGDGYSDLAVGAPGLFERGAVYIYFGGSLWDTVADRVISGNSSDRGFGTTLAGGFDWNGDGFDDLVVGAPESGASEKSGQVAVYFGGATTDPLPSIALIGDAAADTLGSSLLFVASNNGSSLGTDLLIGAPGLHSNDGAVYRLRGRAYSPTVLPLPDDPALVLTSTHVGARFGSSLAGVCRFSDDNALVIGSPSGLLDEQLSFRPGTVDIFQSATLMSLRHLAGENDTDLFGFGLGSFY